MPAGCVTGRACKVAPLAFGARSGAHSEIGAYDKLVLVATAMVLAAWVAMPEGASTGVALALAALLHCFRLARWAGERSWRNPLLVVLHVGYLFVPVGFALMAASRFGLVAPGSGTHAWTAGAFGTMTLAVMSSVSLGHTGRRGRGQRIATDSTPGAWPAYPRKTPVRPSLLASLLRDAPAESESDEPAK